MDAQPLTTLPSESNLHSTLESTPTSSTPASPDVRSSSNSAGSRLLKRLLSGRGSRRYSVLEREPNRLRKRVNQ
ncbi:hypothetical protein N7454_003686 [Penicillium verhagenii]|uniref:uncharacterized protein n=1 Tax=Penicillium verhagenii TaxID=1562060 RepID=UPI002545356C|nr:uncharacterized protein N7466_002445 [Penicillium verhagenii]KAJ5939311.1 hypothetical protein N7466_002445 [Penicillium verhagenii]KAJ5946847.1 hypothetical protein N7454_003686 [Penicillium verhagenii]